MNTLLKNILITFSLLLFSSVASAQKAKTVQKATIKTAIYCAHCKECDSCGKTIQTTLLKEKGIQMITLDENAMTIEVIFNSKKTDLTTIKQAISKLGYDADDVKADLLAYEGLDNCCKK
ncbi:heavy-metal-associated domain-containing protein [Flavobacterium sp. '19STA2R22 D10 B1']|uniref:heavy-metal-associated domain-containing protein n=1 Tax=Flavobacterium aerium TaxID=3037261 RepID=UPI00278C4B57|nr:heavy metal-associated domain-containing protein [Flavobacterium sp. '19STA2R22 D10 B1']